MFHCCLFVLLLFGCGFFFSFSGVFVSFVFCFACCLFLLLGFLCGFSFVCFSFVSLFVPCSYKTDIFYHFSLHLFLFLILFPSYGLIISI